MPGMLLLLLSLLLLPLLPPLLLLLLLSPERVRIQCSAWRFTGRQGNRCRPARDIAALALLGVKALQPCPGLFCSWHIRNENFLRTMCTVTG